MITSNTLPPLSVIVSKGVGHVKAAFWIIPTALLMFSCSDADSLGDQPAREVSIEGIPTFNNGIGELLNLKCGYCHAWPKPSSAPDNVVADLDLTTYDTQIRLGQVIRGADSIGRWIHEGILDHPVSDIADSAFPRQMPLDYGTPVSEREKAYLEEWAKEGSPLDQTPQPEDGDATLGFQIYNDHCVRCHSLGEGVLTEEGLRLGTALRKSASSTAKIKSMWLTRAEQEEPLGEPEAAGVRAFIVQFLTLAE